MHTKSFIYVLLLFAISSTNTQETSVLAQQDTGNIFSSGFNFIKKHPIIFATSASLATASAIYGYKKYNDHLSRQLYDACSSKNAEAMAPLLQRGVDLKRPIQKVSYGRTIRQTPLHALFNNAQRNSNFVQCIPLLLERIEELHLEDAQIATLTNATLANGTHEQIIELLGHQTMNNRTAQEMLRKLSNRDFTTEMFNLIIEHLQTQPIELTSREMNVVLRDGNIALAQALLDNGVTIDLQAACAQTNNPQALQFLTNLPLETPQKQMLLNCLLEKTQGPAFAREISCHRILQLALPMVQNDENLDMPTQFVIDKFTDNLNVALLLRPHIPHDHIPTRDIFLHLNNHESRYEDWKPHLIWALEHEVPQEIHSVDGKNLLFYALARNNFDIAKTIMEVRFDYARTQDEEGLTPLHYILSHSRKPRNIMWFIEMLKEFVNVPDAQGITPLMLAHDPHIILKLYQQGAQLDKTDNSGQMAIHKAVNEGHSDAVALFIFLGLESNEELTGELMHLAREQIPTIFERRATIHIELALLEAASGMYRETLNAIRTREQQLTDIQNTLEERQRSAREIATALGLRTESPLISRFRMPSSSFMAFTQSTQTRALNDVRQKIRNLIRELNDHLNELNDALQETRNTARELSNSQRAATSRLTTLRDEDRLLNAKLHELQKILNILEHPSPLPDEVAEKMRTLIRESHISTFRQRNAAQLGIRRRR